MGLIETIVPVVGTAPVEVVTPKVVSPYVFTENSSSDTYGKVNVFDASIYRMLSMQSEMKTYALTGQANSEFELFMVNGEKLTAGGSVEVNFAAFNNYLGSLGV